VQTWSIYAHPQEQYQGLWLHSKHGEYRLTAPSAEYAPYAEDFVRCVQYAIAIHLFVTDVIGVDDADDDQMMDLEMLMGMMSEQNLDMDFIKRNGSALFDLLRDLTMNKKFKFMVELSKMRAPAVAASTASSSSAGGAASIHASSSSSSSSSNRTTHSTSGKPSPSEARAARVALAARSAAMASPGEGSIDANTAAGSGGMDEGPAGEVEEEEGAEAPKKKQRRRRKAEAGGSGAGSSSSHAASSSSHGAASSSSSSGHHHYQHHTEPPPPQNSNTEEDALLTLPGCPFLHLSSEVPKLMNTLSGHNRRLLVAIEQQRTAEVIAKQLGEFERILNGLAEADFQPMHYLLSGTHSGENFFHGLFDLYRLLKRVRLSCPEQYKPRVAALRVRLVEEFTTPVLRDVWYIQNRGSVRTEVRALKDAEKFKWVQAKLKRLNLERAELRKVKEAEKEVARKEQVQRRKERAARREEWEKGHEARKEARREEKAAGKAAAREAKRVAAAAATAAAEGEVRMEIQVGGDLEEDEDVSRGEKRGAAEGGLEDGPATKRGGIISPDSARTDDSALSSFQKGPEESKCTLSPMVYGGGRASPANGGGGSAKTGLMAGQSSSSASSSRSSNASSSSTTRGAQAVL